MSTVGRHLLGVFLIVAASIAVSAPAAPGPRMKVEWKGGRLSVFAEKVPLSQILKEIARQTGIQAHGVDRLQDPVSTQLTSVALSDALENLLARSSYAILHNPSPKKGGSRIVLVVFNEGSDEGGRGVLAQARNESDGDVEMDAREAGRGGENTDEAKKLAAIRAAAAKGDVEKLRAALLDPDENIRDVAYDALAASGAQTPDAILAASRSDDPGVRLQALETLSQNKQVDERTLLSTLQDALTDQDEDVKGFAIATLGDRGGADAIGYLRQALHDEDPSVREMVIERAAQRPEGLALVQEALSDPDETVRNSAAELLKSARAEGNQQQP